MTEPDIALRASLNNEDDEGRSWALLRDAMNPDLIVQGAIVTAGTARFWVLGTHRPGRP